ncbi:MAG TPA: SDR family oxidoreductase [Acetobacteraceae bacterium]|nr:SDR family oxidoreductase [Acetobacteraceae bacterium]
MAGQNVALVAGAGGIIGRALVQFLAGTEGWRVLAFGRPDTQADEPADVTRIGADLLDAAKTREAIGRAARGVTHLFYAALAPRPTLAEEAAANGAMLANLLDALRAEAAPLNRVVLYQGAKVYGVHLGPVTSPFYEDDARHLPPNFYYTQEDMLRARSATDGFAWSILRPDVVIGDAAGNPMNIAAVIGAYAAICRAEGVPFRYPGSERAYRVLMQMTDARLLAEASLWAATSPRAAGEAFNLVNGDLFRWERLWPRLGRALGLEVGPPMPLTLALHMADKAPLWERLAREHGLTGPAYERLIGWGFGDFIFHTEFDVISDMTKARRHGFRGTADTETTLLDAIARLRARRIIP